MTQLDDDARLDALQLFAKALAKRYGGRLVISADELRGAAGDPRTMRVIVRPGEHIVVWLIPTDDDDH